MNSQTWLWIAILAGGAPALAQTNLPSATGPKAAPKIQFDSTTFNFGRARSGETIKHDFIFTNTGAATLEISAVKPGCGCTTAGAWDTKVEPGKTGAIPLQFNSTGFGGSVAKSASVTCNDPGQSTVVLQIIGSVWKPIDVTPAMLMFTSSSEAPTNETKAIRIVSNLGEPLVLSDIQGTNAAFKAELKEAKPGKEFDLLVTAVPPFASPTVFATITLKTSSTQAPMLSVVAYAVAQPAVTVTPPQVMLPAGALKAPLTSAVMVRNDSTNTLALSDVRLDLTNVDLKVTESQTGRLFSIAMTFPAGFQIQPGPTPVLTFKSSHPKFPLMKVPIVQPQTSPSVPERSAPAPAVIPSGILQTASPLLKPASPIPAAPAAARK